MEAPTNSARLPPSRQANRWWIQLQEAPQDLDLRRRLEAWRNESPDHEVAWLQVERLNRLAAHATPANKEGWRSYLAEQRSLPGKDRSSVAGSAPTARRRPYPRRVVIGSLMAIAASLALVTAPVMLLRLQSDYVTSTAELREVELEDGSSVTLSAESAIAVAFSASERQVKLLKGEAFFQVRSDPRRPFSVLANHVQTTVVGTAFDVRLSDGDVTVEVAEGLVEVGRASIAGREQLRAGQVASFGAVGSSRRSTTPPQMVAAWRQGRLLTAEVPLRDAVEQLRRHFDGMIVLTDTALGDRPITGAYTLSEPENALRAIARAHGAVVRRVTPWVLVISPS